MIQWLTVINGMRRLMAVNRVRVGMRWWLGGIFVAIAALTAALIATVSSRQTERSLRSNSEAIAVGKTVSAAFGVERALREHTLDRELVQLSDRGGLALFVFRRDGHPIGPDTSLGVRWRSVPNGRTALASALDDHRYVLTAQSGATLVALPLRRSPSASAIVAYAPRPPLYRRSIAILHHEIVRAALWAVLAAAMTGFLASALIARRLRRIGRAAEAIERGDFDVRLRSQLGDEVGLLARTIDGMRTRLRESFDRVRAERDRLERLLEQLQEGVIAIDAELRVQVANGSARALLGSATVEPGQPLPKYWGEVQLQELVHGLFRRDAAVAEARAETDDERIISIVGVPAGGSDLAVVVLSDITEHERRERAEREFVANASHELRTPVSAIVSAVEALQSGAKESPADRDRFIDVIDRQALRLGRLTRSLLVMARAQSREQTIRLTPVRLRPLLDEIVRSSQPHDRVELTVDCPDGLCVRAHRDLAEQVFSNLVENALKHTPHGQVVLAAAEREEGVVVNVSDTGAGIPLEARDRVFDRFYSVRAGRRAGFGLGLAIARDAVRALGGRIDIDSEPGTGTTVRVTLARDGAGAAER